MGEQTQRPPWALAFEDLPTYRPAGHEGVVNRSLAGIEVQGSTSVGIWHGTMDRGGHAEPHRHTSDQFYVVLRGVVEVGVEEESCRLGRLGTSYMPAGTQHWIRNVSAEPAEVLVISAPALR